MHHDDWNPSKYSLICSDHFLEKDIDRTGQNVHLRANAIPVRSSEKGMEVFMVETLKYKTPFEHGIKHDENIVLMYLVCGWLCKGRL